MDERSMPIVSVVIPVYNCEAFIRETVESALAQTYPNIEIMVVDDGSTDGTKKQIEDLIKDRRIKYIFQENAGPGVARNTGIKNTLGELIALLDHDDLWMPEKIEKQVQFIRENPWADIVFCEGYGFDEKGNDKRRMARAEKRIKMIHKVLIKKKKEENGVLRPDFTDMICEGIIRSPTSVMFKRRAFELTGDFAKNKVDDWIDDDWDMWLRMAAKGLKFAYVCEVLFKKRAHSANLTKLLMAKTEPSRKTPNSFESFMEGSSEKNTPIAKVWSATNAFSWSRNSMSQGNLRDGVGFGLRAARFNKKYYLKLPGLLVRYFRFMLRRKLGINQ